MPRILITNNHLKNFAGSEMVTLELAEEFVRRGWDVFIYSNLLAPPIELEFATLAKSGKLCVYAWDDDSETVDFDLIWIHQTVLPPRLIEMLGRRNGNTRVVWHHMSALPGLESPILVEIEQTVADQVTFISTKTMANMRSYGLARNDSLVLPNPVPREFCETLASVAETPLTHLLLVSNHPPAEVTEALSVLESEGVRVTRIGGDTPVRVRPEVFKGVDAVITIGKTVQYALCLGIPVYVYDHFGGEGWLTETNFESERESNFSGRATFRKLPASEIAKELRSGFISSRRFTRLKQRRHQQDFSLEVHIDKLLSTLKKSPGAGRSISPSDAKRWSTYSQMQRDTTQSLEWERAQRLSLSSERAQFLERIGQLTQDLESEQSRSSDIKAGLVRSEQHLHQLENSRSMKILRKLRIYRP